MKINVKRAIDKAQKRALKGVKVVKKAAHDTTDEIGNKIGNVVNAVNRTVTADKALKEINQCIQELQNAKKVVMPGEQIDKRINRIIHELKALSVIIKKQPRKSILYIDEQINEFQDNCSRMITEGEDLELQVMTKHYRNAIRACKMAKRILEIGLFPG